MKKIKISTNRLLDIFIYSCGGLLLLTAIAKLISSGGHDRILTNLDPIFHISFRALLIALSIIEFGVAIICLFLRNRKLQVCLIAVLASNFVLYRVGIVWLGFIFSSCPCLGFLTDALHVSAATADTAMKIILAYLLVGSYAGLFWLWRQDRNVEAKMRNDETKLSAARLGTPFGG
jgi:hypothetical protein